VNTTKVLTATAVTIAMAMLAGCGDKKIDGSSKENYEASAQAMYESLPDNKKGAFSQAVTMGPIMGIHEKGETFPQSVNGKTAEEVIAYVNKGIEEKTTLRY